jgi:hypothetical protein
MSELDWLPEHPALGAAITQARGLPPGQQFAAAIALSGFRRDTLSALRIDKLAQGAREGGNVPAGFQLRRLAVMASSTVEHLIPSIRVAALDRRLVLDVQVAPYGQFRQVVLSGDAFLDGNRPILRFSFSMKLPRWRRCLWERRGKRPTRQSTQRSKR